MWIGLDIYTYVTRNLALQTRRVRDDAAHPYFTTIKIATGGSCCWRQAAGRMAVIPHGRPSARGPDFDTITRTQKREGASIW